MLYMLYQILSPPSSAKRKRKSFPTLKTICFSWLSFSMDHIMLDCLYILNYSTVLLVLFLEHTGGLYLLTFNFGVFSNL